MGAFKQLLSQDIIVEPFRVNKGFSFLDAQFNGENVQIGRFLGTNIQSKVFISGSNTPTGNSSVGIQDPELIYNSIKELYYSNFLTASFGSPVTTQSLFPGANESGDVFIGPPNSSGRYENYLQSTITQNRFFPTGSNEDIAVFSIPSRLYGDYIQPKSFVWEDNTNGVSFTDDGNGNIISGSTVVGNIIYSHGLTTLTNQDIKGLNMIDFIDATSVTCSFSSSFDIYETQYKATISENEFNFSQNPSILSGSVGGRVSGFATSSFFSPYVTTVGLYDEAQNLLAVGKLSQPLPTSRTTDTTIFINIDR